MKDVTQLTQPQRKALVDLLGEYGDIFSRARKQYENARNAAKEKLILVIAKEHGADKLLLQYRSLQKQAKAAESKLDELGFDVKRDGDFTFNYNAPQSWHQRIEDELDTVFGTRQQVLDPLFETARVKLWLVPTAEEAEKIVEPLLKFEVKK